MNLKTSANTQQIGLLGLYTVLSDAFIFLPADKLPRSGRRVS